MSSNKHTRVCVKEATNEVNGRIDMYDGFIRAIKNVRKSYHLIN